MKLKQSSERREMMERQRQQRNWSNEERKQRFESIIDHLDNKPDTQEDETKSRSSVKQDHDF